MGDHRRHRFPGQPNRLARLRAGAMLAVLAASAAACTTGSVLSLQPAVDVGPSTASISRVETAAAASQMDVAATTPPAQTLDAQAETLATPNGVLAPPVEKPDE